MNDESHLPVSEQSLVFRLRKRAEIRRQIKDRKSVQEGARDKIADLLEEAADEIEREHSKKLQEDLDHFFQLSGRYLERANDAEDQVIELQSDAALGKILLRYIDRLIDPTPSDPLEKIVDEMIKEAMAAINTTGSKQ